MAGTTRGFLHVYDCESRKEIRRLCEHPKSITSLAVDDDALELVLSASIDGKILIWSYWHYYRARRGRRSTWHLEKTFDAGSQCLKQVAFIAPSVHRSSSTIIATARDGTVKVCVSATLLQFSSFLKYACICLVVIYCRFTWNLPTAADLGSRSF